MTKPANPNLLVIAGQQVSRYVAGKRTETALMDMTHPGLPETAELFRCAGLDAAIAYVHPTHADAGERAFERMVRDLAA